MPLSHLIYVSRSTSMMNENELTELLIKARVFNSGQNITGMLLYKDTSFMQILEGDKGAILSLYNKISEDERHYRVRLLAYETIEQRTFPDWSMGFQYIESQSLSDIEGFSTFMNDGELFCDLTEHQSDKAIQLLNIFRKKS